MTLAVTGCQEPARAVQSQGDYRVVSMSRRRRRDFGAVREVSNRDRAIGQSDHKLREDRMQQDLRYVAGEILPNRRLQANKSPMLPTASWRSSSRSRIGVSMSSACFSSSNTF